MLLIFEQYKNLLSIINLILTLIFIYEKNYFYLSLSQSITQLFKIIIEEYIKNKLKKKRVREIFENNNTEIRDVAVFPSGKIILVTFIYIKILNNDFNLSQFIGINSYEFIDIKDENNFLISSSNLNNIKTYRKQGDLYIFRLNIGNLDNLNFAKYFSKNYLIAVCHNNIRIFKENDLNYELIIKIQEIECKSLLMIKNKNILITTNENCTKFRNLKNYNITKNFNEIKCDIIINGIANIDNERIIILSNCYIYVLSISKNEIIKKINLYNKIQPIHIMEKKNFFLIGVQNYICAYNNSNYKYLISPSIKIGTMYSKLNFKKFYGINDELYLVLSIYGVISIFKY